MTEKKQQVARLGIVTVSDRASRGEYEDRGGPAIRAYFDEVMSSPFEWVARIISDDQQEIEKALRELADHDKLLLDRHHGRDGAGDPRCHARSHRGGGRQTDAGFWRIDAAGIADQSPNCDLVAANRRHPRQKLDCESAGSTQSDFRMPGCGVSRDPLLHRFDRRSVS